MKNSEAALNRIEAQDSTDANPKKRRYFPSLCMFLFYPRSTMRIMVSTLRSLGFLQAQGEGTTPPTEPLPKVFTNISLFDLFDLPGEYVPMCPEIYAAVSAGKIEWMEKLKSYGPPMASLKSDQGDSVLHLAASWGHLELVKSIVYECPCLLLELDWRDQLPLHVAARAGHTNVVEALVEAVRFDSDTLSDEEKSHIPNPYVLKNINGDTPLHLALKALPHTDTYMALSLVYENRCASFLANKDGISPLYLAAESGKVVLVKEMLRTRDIDELKGRKLVHAALKARRTDILDVILDKYPSLENERDEEGKTCLSLGASTGFRKGVHNLLNRSTKSVYVCDDDGSFPIHSAAEKGHLSVVRMLVMRCPDSVHLLNKQEKSYWEARCGWEYTSAPRTLYFLMCQSTGGLAAIDTLIFLVIRKHISFRAPNQEKWMYIRNDSGLTALGVAESNTQPKYIFMERVTLMVLSFFYGKKMTTRSIPQTSDKSKEYVSTLLVVAALVATVTFAAGFTIPGGFNSSAPELGMATLAYDMKLFLFMVFDILAMQSSIVTIATLIWGQLGDPALVQRSLKVALPSLFFSLLCMPVAFYFGVLSAFAHVRRLVIFLRITTVIFVSIMLFVLGPHVFLQLPGIPENFGINFLPLIRFLDEDAYVQASAAKISSKDLVEKQEST